MPAVVSFVLYPLFSGILQLHETLDAFDFTFAGIGMLNLNSHKLSDLPKAMIDLMGPLG
jgi:hypothetical protein